MNSRSGGSHRGEHRLGGSCAHCAYEKRLRIVSVLGNSRVRQRQIDGNHDQFAVDWRDAGGIGNLLVTAKSREVQRGVLAEMRGDAKAATRHVLAGSVLAV